jgi:hypothetical protein
MSDVDIVVYRDIVLATGCSTLLRGRALSRIVDEERADRS